MWGGRLCRDLMSPACGRELMSGHQDQSQSRSSLRMTASESRIASVTVP